MTSRLVRAAAAGSLAAVTAVGAVGVLALLPTTHVASVRHRLRAEDLGPNVLAVVGRGAHVSFLVGDPSITIDHQYFVTPCSVRPGPGSLEVDCPDGPVERWLEPSRVWVVVALPPGTHVEAKVHRDAYFRTEPGVTVGSVEQLEAP